MSLTRPIDAIYPQNRIRRIVEIIYDGTLEGHHEFSIARLELKGEGNPIVIGIRHDRNEWNENTEENGYPVVRGGRPSWFILPRNFPAFLEEINRVTV